MFSTQTNDKTQRVIASRMFIRHCEEAKPTKQSVFETRLLRSLRSLAMTGISLLAMTLLFSCSKASATKEEMPNMLLPQFESEVHAPEFPSGLEWLNVKKPVSLQDLKGKIVLLDFWTYCCINCMHVIPDLKKLEEKYAEELIVIGVHSGKFENEKNIDPIRQAVLRYEIKHPVVNDKDYKIWNSYTIRAWPSFVLINPHGRIIGTHSGEGIYDLFDAVIQSAINYFEPKGALKRGVFETYPESERQPDSPLLFPGKIHASQDDKIFISDSGHNRIIVASTQGEVLDIIGNGKIGNTDGSFEEASFNHPQGLYFHSGILYIADTENHLIRTADMASRTTSNIRRGGVSPPGAGRGNLAPTDVGGPTLRSPWDLVVHENKLYIAMAGSHQLWVADLATHEIRPFAGSGREARIDGPLKEAALAQPSGIDTEGKKLYFADSEVSSIRQADLDPKGKVDTLVGQDLFVFGDKDGKGNEVLLQHPLGVSFHEGKLFVADTYNSKIKILDPKTRESKTFAGTGAHGKENGLRLSATFNEPGGLDVLNGVLYIADTNNHLIRTIDLESGEVQTLNFLELNTSVILTTASAVILSEAKDLSDIDPSPAPQDDRQTPQDDIKVKREDILNLPPVKIPQGKSNILIHVNLPSGHDYTENAPSHVKWSANPDAGLTILNSEKQTDPSKSKGPLRLTVEPQTDNGQLILDSTIYFCHKQSKICYFDKIKAAAPFVRDASAPSEVSIHLDVKVPE